MPDGIEHLASIIRNFAGMIKAFRCCLVLLLIFTGLLSFAQGEKLNQTDKKGMKQGKWRKNHEETGTIRYTGQFKDNMPVGSFHYYDQNGSLQTKMVHGDSGRAFCTMFYPDSGVMARGIYINQVKDSTWTFYNEDGVKISEEHYVLGKPYGNWRVYYHNGQVMEERYFEDGLENGPYKQYFHSGLVKQEATYVDGAFEGNAAFYHENGMLRMEGKYYHDAKEGKWKTYDEKGDLVDERIYRKGVPEFRESDLEMLDTSQMIKKDRLVPADFFEENYTEMPDDEKNKKGKSK